MASSINAITTGSGGVVTTADNSGDLNIQSGGSTKIAVTSAGANIVGTLTVNGAAPAYGKVLQVVNATYSTLTTSSSSTFADTGLTATITPTSATSKILVLVNQCGCGKESNNTNMYLRLLRSGSTIVNIERLAGNNGSTASNFFGSISSSYLDSPATTSATTYKTQFASYGNNALVYTQVDSGGVASTSTITLMEIAA
jgi:hypothetical protein